MFAILITYHLSLVTSTAQSFTQRVQQHASGEGIITIHHDKEIDDLVNGVLTVNTLPKSKTSSAKKTSATTTAKSNTAKDKSTAKSKDSGSKQAATPAPQKDTAQQKPAEPTDTTSAPPVPRHSYKTTGFRVQAFAGGNTRHDRQKAEQTGNVMRQLFPGTDVYVRFFSPRWVCRVGNYRTYEEAREVLQEVRKQGYESATIVKGKIVVYQYE